VSEPQSSFSTPSEFLHYIQACYARPPTPGPPDEEMHRLTREDMLRQGIRLPDTGGPYDLVLRELSSRVAATVLKQRSARITQFSAIGALDDPSVNAGCYRSATRVTTRSSFTTAS
jgi:hypothetical protein